MTPSRAIIRINLFKSQVPHITYNKRMYAIIRRYTPDVVESGTNECLADITGLRTFFKKTYKELAQTILDELARELGVPFAMRIGDESTFVRLQKKNKGMKRQSISTYKEMRAEMNIFRSSGKVSNKTISHHKGIAVPFLGRVR